MGLGSDADPVVWSSRGGLLSTQVNVLRLLPNGTIPIPNGISRIFLEIGPNSHNSVDGDELEQFEDAFLISFEPLLHQYASLLGRRTTPNNLLNLGEHHKRGLALPFAVSPNESVVELRTYGTSDNCASLLHPTPQGQVLIPGCADPAKSADVRNVPSIRLETVLRWLAWEGGLGWPIDYLKLDSSGLDVEVLRSAGELLPRILRVNMGIFSDSCRPIYQGSLRCSQTVEAMLALGYKAAYNRSCAHFGGRCYEENWEFVRHSPGNGVTPLQYGKLAWGGACWVGEMADKRDLCCDKIDQGMVRGCFNAEFTSNRCCAHKWVPGLTQEPRWV